MQKVAIPQGSPAWLEYRKNRIGASEAASILGVGFLTPLQLWEQKLGLRKSPYTPAMQRGVELEPKARVAFEELTGIKVEPAVVVHDKYHWMIASLDGIDARDETIVEIKCPGQKDHHSALEGKIPEKYYPQLQHQMEVCELEKAFYFSFDGESGKLLELTRNDEFIKQMIVREQEFLECLMEFKEPKSQHKKLEILELDGFVNEWMKVKSLMKSLEEKEEELRKNIVGFCGEESAITDQIKILRYHRKGNIDYAQVPELIGVDLEKYRKAPISSWKLTEL